MPIIEELQEPNNVEDNEKENTDVNTVSVTMYDKIALGNASKMQTKLYGDRIESQAVNESSTAAKKEDTIKKFTRFSDNTARTGIINNISILNYFLPLRESDDQKKSSIYSSILKIYKGARQIEEAVQKQRLLHQRATNEISKIHENGEIARQFFEKKFMNLTSLEECQKNNLHAIDIKLLDNCLEIKKEMDNNQANFPSQTALITAEDIVNLCYVLTSEVKIMLREIKPEGIKALLDEIDDAKQLTFEANREKFLLEKELKLFELEIENTIEVLKRLAEKRESIEAELKLLENGKKENNEKKLKILIVCNDPNTINKKKEEHKNACEALRKSFEKKLVEKVEEIDGEQKKLLNDIRNVKTVMRHLNLIFLIDESGSMEGKDNKDGKNHYETVIDCVKACVEKRKARKVTNDKYSVIKFDHRAEISILNRSVKESFGEISAMRKGATSFVEPLKKLTEILNENNFDAFIPVILFMSDGKGESASKVLKQCQTVINDFDNEDMLFFSVAFGKDADVDTLKEMSEAFNKGKPSISIGSKQISVFYRAENQNQLMEAFNVYEKFFDYQENLQETKRNMLTSHLAKQEKIFEQNLKIVEAIDKKNDEFLEASRLQDEKLADNLDTVNGRFETRMETCRKLIGEIRSEENKIKIQKSKHETEKSHLEDTKKNIEEKFRIQNDNFEAKLKAYDICMKTLNEKREKAIQALKDDNNFNKVLEDIADLGVVIKKDQKEQFRIDYKSFIQDFNMFFQEVQELPKNSEAITLLFDRIFAVCEFIRKQQTTAIDLATGEELTNKMWPLFCEYFFNNQSPSEAQDAEMLKELIMSKLPKRDANDPKIEEAFNMIFDYESVRRIFASIEKSRRENKNYVEGFVDKMKDDIDEAIGDLKNQIDDLKENMKNEDDEEEKADIDKRKEKQKDIKDHINEIKNSLAEKRKQKLKISQYSLHIRKILRCLEQMINEVREKYLDATLKNSLESSFKIFRITLNPQMDVLVDGFQASDRAAITSSASNSNGSNFGKLAIKN